jgi:hypothetical protein
MGSLPLHARVASPFRALCHSRRRHEQASQPNLSTMVTYPTLPIQWSGRILSTEKHLFLGEGASDCITRDCSVHHAAPRILLPTYTNT